ncbi:MAG: DUF5688 family protein [Lachnospiraceae bacterium]|nr:DUF5688 family protein [Lachnospiraceae bacterium]
MNYSMFIEQITKIIERRLDHRAQIQISRIQKVNKPPTDGMTILLPGENTAPAIYLDSFYQEYLLGIDLDTIAEEILDFHLNNRRTGTFDLSFYMNFDLARKNIVCRVINYEANRVLLCTIPHQRFLDLAIIYYYRMDDSVFGRSSILVRNAHTEMWGISQERLHTIALTNTRRLLPFRLDSMDDFLCERIPGYTCFMPEVSRPPLYILTNEDFSFGAVNIIFDDVLERISQETCENYYVLPSSIHECLILPFGTCDDELGWETIQDIVKEINENYVSPEEILGNHIYKYTRDSHRLQIVSAQI